MLNFFAPPLASPQDQLSYLRLALLEPSQCSCQSYQIQIQNAGIELDLVSKVDADIKVVLGGEQVDKVQDLDTKQNIGREWLEFQEMGLQTTLFINCMRWQRKNPNTHFHIIQQHQFNFYTDKNITQQIEACQLCFNLYHPTLLLIFWDSLPDCRLHFN